MVGRERPRSAAYFRSSLGAERDALALPELHLLSVSRWYILAVLSLGLLFCRDDKSSGGSV